MLCGVLLLVVLSPGLLAGLCCVVRGAVLCYGGVVAPCCFVRWCVVLLLSLLAVRVVVCRAIHFGCCAVLCSDVLFGAVVCRAAV